MSLNWLFLDLNSFFASVEQQENSHLRGRPVGVVPVNVSTTCCLAASYEAKAHGVKTGTLLYDAKRLCPDITFVEARHDVYVRYHHAIVQAVEACMPVTVVMSIDEMAGRLMGSEKIKENAVSLAQRIKETIYSRVGECLRCSIGIAPNRFLAKVASEMKKPNGLVVLDTHDLPHKLHSLKLQDIPGVGRNMEKRLNAQGIYTMETLCSLDDPLMYKAWGGIWGKRMAQWLRGVDLELGETKHRSLGHSHVLEPSLRSKKGAMQVSKRLLAKAAWRLRKMGYWSAGLSLQVSFRERRGWGRFTKLIDTQDTPTFLEELGKMWEEYPGDEPMWVAVTLAPLISPTHHTLPLFGNPKKEKLSHVMDALNNRFGKNTATYANLMDTDGKAPTRIPFTRIPDLSEF